LMSWSVIERPVVIEGAQATRPCLLSMLLYRAMIQAAASIFANLQRRAPRQQPVVARLTRTMLRA